MTRLGLFNIGMNWRLKPQPALRRAFPIACLLLGLAWHPTPVGAQEPSSTPDYSKPAKPFPLLYKPYVQKQIPEPDIANSKNAPLTIRDGVLQLSMAQLITAVVENNLTIASARWYSSIAQADLMRSRSGSSPRGVDQSHIPAGIFSGSEGSSILGTASGSTSGSSNPGGITGTAGAVRISPAGVFDPRLVLSFSHDQTDSPLNTERVAGIPAVSTQTAAFSASYVQAFSSGTSFAVSYGMQSQTSNQLHILFNPAITPGFTATVSQQLVNGFGFAVNRALIKFAENEQKIERESFRMQVINSLVGAEDAYWDLVAAQETVRAAEQALKVAEELQTDNERQVQVGTMAPLDVVTAQSQVAASQRDLIVAQSSLQKSELQLKTMFTTKMDDRLASTHLETTEQLPNPADTEIPGLEQATTLAEQNRPELPIVEGNIKSDQDAMPFMTNALLPNVNAFALITNAGLFNVFGTSFTEAIQFKYPEYAFGLTISFPFRNRQAEADQIHSRLDLQQAKISLTQSQSNIDVEVQNAIIGLQQSKAQIAAAEEAVSLAQESLDAEQKKLEAGVSTAYNVILQQRDLFSAQLAEVQARDAYAKARIEMDRATGMTLQKSHISVDDALKGQVNGVIAP